MGTVLQLLPIIYRQVQSIKLFVKKGVSVKIINLAVSVSDYDFDWLHIASAKRIDFVEIICEADVKDCDDNPFADLD